MITLFKVKKKSHFVFNDCLFLDAVTPNGSNLNPPREHQEGEAGFAIMFPSMDGVQIKPFHFCKKSISPTALKEAGLFDLTAVHLPGKKKKMQNLQNFSGIVF